MKEKTKLFDKIEEKYNELNEDGKRKNKAFFDHLIRAYLPKKSVSVAIKNPDSKKIRVKCVFSGDNLITVDGVLKETQTEEFKNNLSVYLHSFDSSKGCFTSPAPIDKALKGRELALQGKDTKTYMSQDAYLEFVNWVMSKSLSGDKNITFILNKVTKNPFSKRGPLDKPNFPKNYSSGNKKTTFGDLESLQKLKEKFKNEE